MNLTEPKIKVYRSGWTIAKLAHRIGCSRAAITRVLQGDRHSPVLRERIARITGIPQTRLFGKM